MVWSHRSLYDNHYNDAHWLIYTEAHAQQEFGDDQSVLLFMQTITGLNPERGPDQVVVIVVTAGSCTTKLRRCMSPMPERPAVPGCAS